MPSTPSRTPRATTQQLGTQVRAVVADLPLFLAAAEALAKPQRLPG